MIEIETLKRWCAPPTMSDPYLRPFVIRGPLSPGGAAIVGLNPATKIHQKPWLTFDRYVNCLLDVDQFAPVYERVRLEANKSQTLSNTRKGLNWAAGVLEDLGCNTIVDTNASPYPTDDSDEFGKLPTAKQCLHVLPEVLATIKPSVVLLHGEFSYRNFVRLFAAHGRTLSWPGTFTEIAAKHANLGVVQWPFGGQANVFLGPHLRFFNWPKMQPLRDALLQFADTR